MKINDKQLAYFASCHEPTDLEGWLWKKGELNTSYQKRWCVLRGNLFFYFEKRYDKEPIGVIVLENCFVQLAEGGDSPYTFSIHFTGEGSRVYKLTADDDASCTSWIKALSISSYRYLEILVEGLERDLENLQVTTESEMPRRKPVLSFTKADNDKSQLKHPMHSDINLHQNQFSSLTTKSISLNNVTDDFSDEEEDLLSFNITSADSNGTLKKIPRSRSSGELSNSFNSTSNDSSAKVKIPNHKQKTSMMRKLSPRLGRKKHGNQKTSKTTELYFSSKKVTSQKGFAFSSLNFLELHEKYREEIHHFIVD